MQKIKTQAPIDETFFVADSQCESCMRAWTLLFNASPLGFSAFTAQARLALYSL